jgi:hypothetical protein
LRIYGVFRGVLHRRKAVYAASQRTIRGFPYEFSPPKMFTPVVGRPAPSAGPRLRAGLGAHIPSILLLDEKDGIQER